MDPKVQEARAKLAEKFGDSTRTGGAGSQRRKKKTVHKTQLNDDKKIKTMIRKFNVQPLPDITEVNMFKEDHSVLHFKAPEVMASLPSNTFVVIGKGEQKSIEELLPDILPQMGHKQAGALQSLLKKAGAGAGGIKEAPGEDEEDVPNLVNQDFEEASKKQGEKAEAEKTQ